MSAIASAFHWACGRTSSAVSGRALASRMVAIASYRAGSSNRPLSDPPVPLLFGIRVSSLIGSGSRSSGSAPSWSSISISCWPQVRNCPGVYTPIWAAICSSAPACTSGSSRLAACDAISPAITSTCRRLASPATNRAAVAGSRAGSCWPCRFRPRHAGVGDDQQPSCDRVLDPEQLRHPGDGAQPQGHHQQPATRRTPRQGGGPLQPLQRYWTYIAYYSNQCSIGTERLDPSAGFQDRESAPHAVFT